MDAEPPGRGSAESIIQGMRVLKPLGSNEDVAVCWSAPRARDIINGYTVHRMRVDLTGFAVL